MKKLLYFSLFLAAISSAIAFPPIPAYYEGHAYLDGKLVGKDIEIKAVSASGDEFKTTTFEGGYYQLTVILDDPESERDEGASFNEPLSWYVTSRMTSNPAERSDVAISGEIQSDFDLSAGGSAPKPTCADGIRNQGEGGVDCGGPCDPCPGSKVTTTVKASQSTIQRETTTTSKSIVDKLLGGDKADESAKSNTTSTLSTVGGAGTCADGIRNQGETGVDCGGPCKACGGGMPSWLYGLIIVGVLVVIGVVLLAAFFYLIKGKGLRGL
ncbi:MAG: hypothetical protein V1921_01890 [Candidatus Altiarchaeota archaeon]